MNAARREQLRADLGGLGFDVVRFAAAEGGRAHGLCEWLAAGYHADMAWLERGAEKRENPELVLPGARSVIVLGVNYWPGRAVDGGRFARYALHSDYHDSIGRGLRAAGAILEAQHGLAATDYRFYVDAGPVQERGWAAAAGVGFRGKNGNVISRFHGNWLLLAAILVRLEIPPDRPLAPADPGRTGLHCGKCTRCLDGCPTAAFPAPGIVDSRRCISYHTIENRGFVPRALRPLFGGRVFGCDECLAVCPWNRFAQESHSVLLDRRHDLAALTLLELLQLTPERYREVFRRTACKRTKLPGLLRNACIAAGNVHARSVPEAAEPERMAIAAELERLARHESPVVRGHAVWALRRIQGDDRAANTLAAVRAAETENSVLAEYAADLLTPEA